MLRLDTFTATRLLSLNVRTENHGDGLARAVDLKCQMDAPNTFLDQLDATLLDMLFKPLEADETQAKLEGMSETKPLLRTHAIKFPIELDGDYSGYQITVDRGLGGTSNMVLLEAKLNKMKLTCLEGGTVQLQYRLQVSNVGDDVIGKLSSYIKSDMHLALLPPQIKPPAIDGSQKAFDADHPEADKKEAPTGHEAGDTLAANEAAGLNKPGSEVPPPPKAKKRASGKPSLQVTEPDDDNEDDGDGRYNIQPVTPQPIPRSPVKYRSELTGETWSGRGLMPKWIKARIDDGASLADFEVKTEVAA